MIQQSNSSNSFDRISFYKEIYYKELDRKSSLNNEVTLQGTILVALLSGIFFLFTSTKSKILCVNTCFNIVILINIVLILVTGYYLFKSYYDFDNKGRKYHYLPKISDIEQYYVTCSQRSNSIEFESYLIDTLIVVADSHIEKNDHKTLLLTNSAKWMAWSFRLAAVIIVMFLLNTIIEPYISSKETLTTKKLNKNHVKQEQSDRSKFPAKSTLATNTTTTSITAAGPATTSSERDNRKRGQETIHH